MAHDITISEGTKEDKYRVLLPQIKALLEGEDDMVARMANAAAAIHFTFGFLWTGFYRVLLAGTADEKADHTAEPLVASSSRTKEPIVARPLQPQELLVVGPFQGPVACSRIAYGKGVCGSAWKEGRTLVVPNVEQFPGHIRCSSAARSEIVVPVFAGHGQERKIIAVLDIDSAQVGTFDQCDAEYLEKICSLVSSSGK